MRESEDETKLRKAVFDLDALRESLGLTVPELANRADMDAEHLWSVVNGAPTTPAEAARLGMELAFVLMTLDVESVPVA